MAEHGCDLVAAGALDIHEIGVGALDKALQLALALLLILARVQQIFSERHILWLSRSQHE